MPEHLNPAVPDFDRQLAGHVETMRARNAAAALLPDVRARTAARIAAMQELVDAVQPPTDNASGDNQTR